MSFHLRESFSGMDPGHYLLYFVFLDINGILFWCLEVIIGDFIMFLWNSSSFASILCLTASLAYNLFYACCFELFLSVSCCMWFTLDAQVILVHFSLFWKFLRVDSSHAFDF